ncbi:MAG: antibiotic biosynthesis monooxygenase [Gammaproteobacteria bacterium]|nr:antibiotic biosynthesis monooxygenase [Gammaproteobacteria bacterium]
MFAVIFEVVPDGSGKAEYLEIAAELRRLLENRDGFISIERFQSLNDEGKILSLSFWRDEAAIAAWRNEMEHRSAQQKGKASLFESYRIRVAEVVRDYTQDEREQAPADSKQVLS